MSKCKGCGYDFREENGWQEFCSVKCAREYTMKMFSRKKDNDDVRESIWKDWYTLPKNRRLVRNGEPARPPSYGKWKNVVIEDGDEVRVVRTNVGGQLSIRPMSEADRKVIEYYNGRGFGENHRGNKYDKSPGERKAYGYGEYKRD